MKAETDHLMFLDDLRESGVTNMWGGTAFLMKAFNLNETDARSILIEWMETFSERHPE